MRAFLFGEKSGRTWFLLALLSTLPVLLSPLVMLPDLFSHIGRFHVMLANGENPLLNRYYAFNWRLIGNLGVDLPVYLLGQIMSASAAARIVVATIPALTISGIYYVSRLVHGQLDPSAYLALPLVYSFPFLHGFVNFALSVALALLALPLWLRLSSGHWIVAIFAGVIVSSVLWITHIAGYAIFLILAGWWMVVEFWQRSDRDVKLLAMRLLRLLSLLMPLLPTLFWRGSGGGFDIAHNSLRLKLFWIGNMLRGEDRLFDVACMALICIVSAWLVIDWRFPKQWKLFGGALILVALFFLLPQVVFGSYYADLRILPAGIIVLMVSIQLGRGKAGYWLALGALTLFGARLIEHGVGWQIRGARLAQDLQALDQVHEGARIAAIATRSLCNEWTFTSFDHAPSLAIERRNAFVNSEWDMKGQLMKPIYNEAYGYNAVPSDLLATAQKPCDGKPMQNILDHLPKSRFDYVWIFAPPAEDRMTPWLELVYRGPQSRLYRIKS